MDDRFMKELHEAPRPDFERALRQRLRAGETLETRSRRGLAWRPLLASAAAVAVVASLVLLPSVRVSAQAFLDLFRVRQFTAVSFDPSRLDRLHAMHPDNATLVFGKTEKLVEPGAPQAFTDLRSADTAAGFEGRTPAVLPQGLALDTVMVEGAATARMTVDAKSLRSVLTTLDIRDVTVPDDIDGKTLTVRTTPMMVQHFRSDRFRAQLLQGRSPEVELPPGLDMRRLGDIGLRILGVSPADARRLAMTIDWRSTLVVPVPRDAASFRQVTVHGIDGLLVTRTGVDSGGKRERSGAVVMWTEGDRIYAVSGDLDRDDLLAMAESVH